MPRAPSAAAREAWSIMETLVTDSRRATEVRIHDLGLAPRQARALRRLDPDVPIAMSRLAEALHCDNSNVTQIVDRLEADGLVERRPAPHDRRGKGRGLTQGGRPGGEGAGADRGGPPGARGGRAPDDRAAAAARGAAGRGRPPAAGRPTPHDR